MVPGPVIEMRGGLATLVMDVAHRVCVHWLISRLVNMFTS